MYSSAFRFASLLTLVLLALLAAEQVRDSVPERVTSPVPSTTQSFDRPSARIERAYVAPVRRVMPKTPPLPEAILLAGDVEEPSRAPDLAPVPGKRDWALALMHMPADAVAADPNAVKVPVAATKPVPKTAAEPRALAVAKPRNIDFTEGRMSLKGPAPEPRPARRPE